MIDYKNLLEILQYQFEKDFIYKCSGLIRAKNIEPLLRRYEGYTGNNASIFLHDGDKFQHIERDLNNIEDLEDYDLYHIGYILKEQEINGELHDVPQSVLKSKYLNGSINYIELCDYMIQYKNRYGHIENISVCLEGFIILQAERMFLYECSIEYKNYTKNRKNIKEKVYGYVNFKKEV